MSRSSVGIKSQFGIEGTAGAGGSANRFCPTLKFNPASKQANEKFRGMGSRTTDSVARHKQWGGGGYEGVLDYNSFNYVCEGLFNTAAPAQIGSLIAYTRQYVAGMRTLDNLRKTFTFEKGDATAADKYNYGQLLSLALEAAQESFNIKGNIAAQKPLRNQVLTASPTTIAKSPVQRGDVNFYVDSTFGALGTTQFTEVFRESLDIGDKYQPAWFHNRSKASWGAIVELPYEAMFSFSTAHNAQSRTLLAAIDDNPVKFLRWEAVGRLLGNNAGTDVFEKIMIDMAVQFDEPEEIDDAEGVYAYNYKAILEPNDDLGSHLIITTVSGLATL